MSSKVYKKPVKPAIIAKKKKKKEWKKKTPLQKGATVSNWGSLFLMIATFILFIVKVCGINITWFWVWAPFIAGVVLGIGWFIFVLIMINIFGKK